MHKKEFRSLICSMLIGDGCLYSTKLNEFSKKHTKNPKKVLNRVWFCMTHSDNQADYAVWKSELINEIFRKKNLPKRCTMSKTKKTDIIRNKDYYGVYVKFSWAEYFRLLRKRTHKQLHNTEIKNVEYLLSQMDNDLHTAIWFMDDGTEKRKRRFNARGELVGWDNPAYELYTYAYTEGQHQLIKQWFNNKHSVNPTINTDTNPKRKDKNKYLRFSVSDSRLLFEKLSPYFSQIESMKKKFWLSFDKYYMKSNKLPLRDDDIVQTTTERV